MFIKLTIFFLVIALVFVILMAVRRHRKKISSQNKGKIDWSHTLKTLTLPQLRQEKFDLEKQRISTSSGFINMNSVEKDKAIGRVTKINRKLEQVQQAIEDTSIIKGRRSKAFIKKILFFYQRKFVI